MLIFSQFGEIAWQRLFNIVRILQTIALNLFTLRVKNDEFRLGRVNSEFVSIKPRRNMGELYVKNSCYGSQVIMTRKDICIISKENDRQEVGDMKKIIDVYKKSKGPRTEPWGTPQTTKLYEEVRS